jgi:GYF domain 2
MARLRESRRMYKIIGADGKEYGPVTAEQLRQWIAEGRANAQSRVLPDGATEWVVLSQLPEFASSFPISPPPLAEPRPQNAPAAEEVSGPAVGLMAVAVLGFAGQATGMLIRFAGFSMYRWPYEMGHHGMPNWALLMSGTVGLIAGVIALAMSVLVFAAGFQMKRLENYGLAMAGSIAAMIPCFSPCCWIGLPIGIWALVILAKPEVKSAFH